MRELLGDDEAARDHEAGEREQPERGPEREPEPLRLVREAVERVDDDERGGGDGRQEEQDEQEGLGARLGLARGDDAGSLARRPRRLPAAESEHEPRDEPVLQLRHLGIRLPKRVHMKTSAAAATSQLTAPSGQGPRWPIDQPPGSRGCFA